MKIMPGDYQAAYDRACQAFFELESDHPEYDGITFQELLRCELTILREREIAGEFIPEDGKHISSGQAMEAEKWLSFCVRKLREAEYLSPGIRWATEIVPGCTVEELMGAVLAGFENLAIVAEAAELARAPIDGR